MHKYCLQYHWVEVTWPLLIHDSIREAGVESQDEVAKTIGSTCRGASEGWSSDQGKVHLTCSGFNSGAAVVPWRGRELHLTQS